MVFVNIIIFGIGIFFGRWWPRDHLDFGVVTNLLLANLAVVLITRQQLFVNFIFNVATLAPTRWPLALRRRLAKVYHFGGVHVGGALMSTFWFLVLIVSLTQAFVTGTVPVSLATLSVTYALLMVFLVILALAHSGIRARHHDWFERSHRFGNWLALALFCAQIFLLDHDRRGDLHTLWAVMQVPGLWMLGLMCVCVALPWTHLRRVPVRIDRPSAHVALLHFDHGPPPALGSTTTVSRHPLLEWHTFANVPATGETGFRLVVSRAGDWTGELIANPPSHLWIKGIPTSGVVSINRLFKRVIWVATGSGIGPTLGQLLAQTVPAHLIWSVKSPRRSYGDALINEILAVQPDALFWDTDKHGRPDLVTLAYEAYVHFNAEAIICISNQTLTWEVVQALEQRGIPAYGAIWDS